MKGRPLSGIEGPLVAGPGGRANLGQSPGLHSEVASFSSSSGWFSVSPWLDEEEDASSRASPSSVLPTEDGNFASDTGVWRLLLRLGTLRPGFLSSFFCDCSTLSRPLRCLTSLARRQSSVCRKSGAGRGARRCAAHGALDDLFRSTRVAKDTVLEGNVSWSTLNNEAFGRGGARVDSGPCRGLGERGVEETEMGPGSFRGRSRGPSPQAKCPFFPALGGCRLCGTDEARRSKEGGRSA